MKLQTTQKNIASLSIQGHAEYAEQGEDLVCAGVSSIAIGLLNALEKFNSESNYSMKDNCISIEVNDLKDQVTQIALKTAVIQLETMQDSYKAYIKIKKQEV